jgi:hypothetical protein
MSLTPGLSARRLLSAASGTGSVGGPPTQPVTWAWQSPSDDTFTLESHGSEWTLARDNGAAPEVTVTASARAWADSSRPPGESRRLLREDLQLEGGRADQGKFATGHIAQLVDDW